MGYQRNFGRLLPSTSAILMTASSFHPSWFSKNDDVSERSPSSPKRSIPFCEGIDNTPDSVGNQKQPKSKLVFLGSGSSTGCPKPLCTLVFGSQMADDDGTNTTPIVQAMQQQLAHRCVTSNLASTTTIDPVHNKDYRNNPSFLISLVDPITKERRNVVIDVGKTFREGALRWFPRLGVQSIDSIILTHEHMDAAGGLDDVRGFQPFVQLENTTGTSFPYQQIPMPLFLSERCLSCLQDQFPWLLPKEQKKNADGEKKVQRHVASFDATVFAPFQAFEPIPDFHVTPLPIMHGEDLVSFGFSFSVHNDCNVVYLSDISRMLPETQEHIQQQSQPIHILVLDALMMDGHNAVHFNLEQAVELVRVLKPRQTFLVGMNCDAFPPHDEANAMLAEQYPDVSIQLAYDGLQIDVN